MADVVRATGISIAEPLTRLWEGVVNAVPGVVAAIIVLVLGFFVAWLISWVVVRALRAIQLDKWVLEHLKVHGALGKFEITHLLGTMTKWFVFVLFLPPAADLVQLPSLSAFFQALSLWIPNLIVAVLIGIFGFMAAEYVGMKVEEFKGKATHIVAWAAKALIILFTVLIALEQIGVSVSVAESSFLVVLGGIMLAVALAAGISFGFALKDNAKGIVSHFTKKMK